jgi:hypothetical protein
MLAAANATNGTHPEVVSGVASTSQSVDDAVQGSQAAAQLSSIQHVVSSIQQQTSGNQQKIWDSASASEQQQLRTQGISLGRGTGRSGAEETLGAVPTVCSRRSGGMANASVTGGALRSQGFRYVMNGLIHGRSKGFPLECRP